MNKKIKPRHNPHNRSIFKQHDTQSPYMMDIITEPTTNLEGWIDVFGTLFTWKKEFKAVNGETQGDGHE